MKSKHWLLGSHISLNKPNQYLIGTTKETINNEANIYMIFTGAPQNKRRVDLDKLFIKEAKELAISNKVEISNCVVHAPYLINLATNIEENIQFNIDFLILEIKRSVEMGIKLIVLHPGFHVKQSLEEGIKNIIKRLLVVLEKTESMDFYICLETMAGKSNQIGKTIEEIATIIKGCKNHKKLGVCLDTCHLHDAGYDLSKKDEFLEKCDKCFGLERIKLMHLGDSMNERGSKKDRHANLGYGFIGFENLMKFAHDKYLSTLPIIVETPYWIEIVKEKKVFISPYKHEIELIKKNEWKPIPVEKYLPIFNINK